MAAASARVGDHIAPLSVPRHRPVPVVTLLFFGDLLAITAALLLACGIRSLFGPLDLARHLPLLPALFLFILGFLYAGLYPGYGLGPVEELRRANRTTALVSLLLLASTFLFRSGQEISRVVIIIGWVLALFAVPLVRAALRALFAGRSWWGQPVLILGAAKTADVVIRRLKGNPGLGLRPVCCLDDDPAKVGRSFRGVPVAGPLSLAPDLAKAHGIQTAIIAMPGLRRERLTQVVEEYGAVFPQVIVVPDLLGLTSLWVTARDIQGVLGLQLQQNLLSTWSRFLKRTLDLAVAVPALVIAGPVILLLGWLVKLNSPGPAFYSQEREGLDGKRIRVWKLRTMVPDAEKVLHSYLAENPEAKQEWDQYMKLRNDPRIVPMVGHLLRRLSLDELPQLWNIALGEMSLVGPRPFPDYHLNRFTPAFRALRCRVVPGLTGLWQVSARSDGDLAIQEELDTYYIRNWSLWMDVYLLARTVTAVLFGKGAY
ncbi:MAG TPA: undecaprenyl-phosphate galactose phosphotransferase WbaP [Symbiobacteriaceae bacterium]|nr:undecaprenyl-phosphate galactose phosphotransferase WbaP [Symbiobacteriaceae bacterium]